MMLQPIGHRIGGLAVPLVLGLIEAFDEEDVGRSKPWPRRSSALGCLAGVPSEAFARFILWHGAKGALVERPIEQ